jgi:hypothetical protein
VFVVTGGYAGIMTRMVHVEARRITVVVLLDVDHHDVMLQKRCMLRETSIRQGAWTDAEEEYFIPLVLVTTWHSLKADSGRIMYQTPLRFRIQFESHRRDIPKYMVRILDVQPPPMGLDAVGEADDAAKAAPPPWLWRPEWQPELRTWMRSWMRTWMITVNLGARMAARAVELPPLR